MTVAAATRAHRTSATPLRPSLVKTRIQAGQRTTTSIEVGDDDRSKLSSKELRLASYFESVFSSTPHRLVYNANWENGTDYLNGIVQDQALFDQLEIGERASFVDNHGRRALAICTPMGIACVFERYTDQPWTLAYHMPLPLVRCGLFDSDSGRLTEESLRTLFLIGGLLNNINSQMAALVD